MSNKKPNPNAAQNEALRLLSSIASSVNASLAPAAEDFPEAGCKEILDKYPLLHSAIFAPFQEGGPEEGATLIMWGSDGGVTILCNLKWLKAKAYFTHTSLWEALESIERALGDPQFKWQREKPQKRSRKGYGYKSR